MSRLIDQETEVRTRPMKVLAIGMCRTGTMSMKNALGKLGYRCYHMEEAIKKLPRDLNLWTEAMRIRSEPDKLPYGREEFDKLIGDFDACTDVPAADLALELIAAYPEAKIVLTTRDEDSWLRSMERTIIPAVMSPSHYILQYFDSEYIGPLHRWNMTWKNGFCKTKSPWSLEGWRKGFREHNDAVRMAVPKERFLEFKIGMGWKDLCEFLEQPVPEEKWPRMNSTKEFFFEEWRATKRNRAIMKMMGTLLPVLVTLCAVTAGLLKS